MISRPVTLFSFRYQPPTARCRIHIFQDHFLRIPSIHDTITDTAPHHPSRIPTFYSIHQVAVPRRPSIHASTHSPIVAPNASCRLSLLRPVAAQRIDKENAAKVKRSSCQQHRQGKVLDGTVPCCTATLQRNPQDGNPLPGVSSTSTRKSITTNNGGIKLQIRSITSAHRNLGPGPLPHRLAWPPSFLTLTSSTSQLAPVNKPLRVPNLATNPLRCLDLSSFVPGKPSNPRTIFSKTTIRIASPVSACVPALDQDSQPASHNRYLTSGPLPCLALATPSQQLRQPTSPCALSPWWWPGAGVTTFSSLSQTPRRFSCPATLATWAGRRLHLARHCPPFLTRPSETIDCQFTQGVFPPADG
ncbi:hypothetical protein CTAM01_14807 [Colletotrichum tamarilloi]|uniref:Uncharacterized protein n=1 Tax=Colletotrichum tamarilloi TaxID=1209934 RepID=A0ABQ9QN60_9PEZI|nr:uncharacterized protein CTAM01_14807 [Colletotrichum tamarilloi]KAK1479152.1 hypothetical protein CTAM01_14807 [Colletotrichum tamarilloi]